MASTAPKRILVTAGLPYSNGRLHVGHIAGAYLPSDIYVRYLRLRGADVRYVCGSDDHGVAIVLSAEKEGKTAAEISKFFNEEQRRDFERLGISFDIYSSTSRNPYHYKTSQDFFEVLCEKGCFEKERTRQFYDEAAQMFLPDRFVKGTCGYCGTADQNGDQCENCGKMLDVDTLKNARNVRSGNPLTIRETVHWFLDLSRFEGTVKQWLEGSIIRDHTRNYVEGLLSTGLVRRSMTRDLDWGIPLPLKDPEAKGKVLYVWFDAPIGYISNTMELCAKRDGDAAAFTKWWRSDDCDIIHFIGEDNTIFHCVVWIAMLSAEGSFRLPRGVIVNQYLNFQKPGGEVEKFSKSRGNAVWIGDYLDTGNNPDSLRYYLTAIAPESARSVYSPEDFVLRHNGELVNTLGNFVHRVLTFTQKYFGPNVPDCPAAKVTDVDRAFAKSIEESAARVSTLLEGYRFKDAQEAVMALAREANRYFDQKAPWSTRKTDMETTAVTMWHGIAAIRFFSIALAPFLPFTAAKIAAMLGKGETPARWEDAKIPLPVGSPLAAPQILFQKIEDEIRPAQASK
jgi:methionyl-tRNA synthetase